MAQDVREPDGHRAVAAAAAERGPVKVWVNNAGILRTRKAWEHSDDEVRTMVGANLLGVIWGSRAAVEAMRSDGGHLINMASMSALGPVPGLAVYGSTKHAVLAFSTSLQGDVSNAGFPIRVHAVCPDGVDTGMVQERVGDPEAAIIFSAPKLLKPDEVAERIVALLDSKRIVEVIPRSRGWLIRVTAPYPRVSLKMLEMFRRAGERKRRKAAG
jgi:NAD(P)-dependent dehydrogenase (short-subunit alcohol dehydrogenase family)